MARAEAVSTVLNLNPRLARTAGWALLGGVAAFPVWHVVDWLASLDLDLNLGALEWPLRLFLIGFFTGLPYTGLLGVALWRARVAGWRRAAGFALLAMFWFMFGFKVGASLGWDNRPDLPEAVLDFVIWFTGLLTMTVWVALAGIVTMPLLRSRRAVAWLLGGGVVFAALVGVTAIGDVTAPLDYFTWVLAAWGAVQAAAFSLALPPTQRGGDMG
jgi:hypothetical protein